MLMHSVFCVVWMLTLTLGLFSQIAQLRHELSMRDDLLHFYASTEDIEHASETLWVHVSHTHTQSDQQLNPTILISVSSSFRLIRNDSSSSLSNYVNYDFLQQKLKGLEEENFKLRTEVCLNAHLNSQKKKKVVLQLGVFTHITLLFF